MSQPDKTGMPSRCRDDERSKCTDLRSGAGCRRSERRPAQRFARLSARSSSCCSSAAGHGLKGRIGAMDVPR